jgi:hypothetical protein
MNWDVTLSMDEGELGSRLAPDHGIAPTRVRNRTNNCVKKLRWHKEEDELLMRVMSESPRPNYARLAHLFPGKTGQQVSEHWDKVLNPRLTKGAWTRQEDEIIVAFVEKNGTKQWQKLCALLPGRIGKQCRERWRNHLDPAINHAPWTPEEDEQLRRLHREHGNAWVAIASLMRNRSDNAVKNRWNAVLRKTEAGQPRAACGEADGFVTPPVSSPFVALQPPVAFLSPILAVGKGYQKKAGDVGTLEENRVELLKLMLE